MGDPITMNNASDKKLKVLVVAQTPPPIHGQSIMSEYLLSGTYTHLELHLTRMAFSDNIADVGKADFRKIIHLVKLMAAITMARIKLKPDVFYFLPASPNMVPFLRDCALLIPLRWLFPKTVFHFHAAGLLEFYNKQPAPLKWLFRCTYWRPEVAISVSKSGLRDAEFVQAHKAILIPNGIPDNVRMGKIAPKKTEIPTILFLAMVCEEKGVGILIEACKILRGSGHTFQCKIAGKASSEQELQQLKNQAAELGESVQFVGQVTGSDKWSLFAEADIFCFPTFYASESFSLVALEALMTRLPLVTSDWRGLPEIVEDGKTGFIVPTHDVKATADRLAKLLGDPELRKTMGTAAREHYLKNFHIDIFRHRMEEALLASAQEAT